MSSSYRFIQNSFLVSICFLLLHSYRLPVWSFSEKQKIYYANAFVISSCFPLQERLERYCERIILPAVTQTPSRSSILASKTPSSAYNKSRISKGSFKSDNPIKSIQNRRDPFAYVPAIPTSSTIDFTCFPFKNVNSEEIKENVHPKYIPKEVKLHWHPKYMAKALTILPEFTKWVDFVIFVQDARIPFASSLPMMDSLLLSKPIIRVLTHVDMASEKGCSDWRSYYQIQGKVEMFNRFGKTMNSAHHEATPVIFANAQKGDKGIVLLQKKAIEIGKRIQLNRQNKGLLPRPLRGAVVGAPNVGKSALINRLLNRKKAISSNIPGVTREIKWARLGRFEQNGPAYRQLELLDTPGFLPSRIVDQIAAWSLVFCGDIPSSGYDVAAAGERLLDKMFEVWKQKPHYIPLRNLKSRYGVDPLFHGLNSSKFSGGFYLDELSRKNHHFDENAAAMRVLTDFRKHYLGKITLEIPPKSIHDSSSL